MIVYGLICQTLSAFWFLIRYWLSTYLENKNVNIRVPQKICSIWKVILPKYKIGIFQTQIQKLMQKIVFSDSTLYY